jgi:4-hydroxy-tetrahydrodipicolinate synthase
VTEHVAGRLPLVLGMGGNNTAALTAELKDKRALLEQHFAAILSVCPYYNKPSQEGLYRHFKAVAEASPVPVVLYNVPGRTGVNMLPETAMRLWEEMPEQIAGVKEASGNTEQIRALINMAEEGRKRMGRKRGLKVISGDDGLTAELMDAGAAGLISVAANAFPQVFRRIVHEADHSLQTEYSEMVRLLFKEGNPAGIKTVLSLQGLMSNTLRLPLVSNSAAVQADIKAEMERLAAR